MNTDVMGERIREVLLEVVDECARKGPGYFQQGLILQEAAERLGDTSSGELGASPLDGVA